MNVTMNDVKFGFRKIIKTSIANFVFYNRLEEENKDQNSNKRFALFTWSSSNDIE